MANKGDEKEREEQETTGCLDRERKETRQHMACVQTMPN